MKNLLIILMILISSVGYSQTGTGRENLSPSERFVVEYNERCKTPYLYSEDKGNEIVDYQNFNKDLVEYLILVKINNHRVSNGVGLLVEDTLTKQLARGWSEVMDSTSSFYHNPESSAMECISKTNSSARVETYNEMAESNFQTWKNSKGHNYVMLKSDGYYGSVGISYSYKECDEYSDSGTNLCEMFDLPGNYKMYVTFNSIISLGHL